MSTITIEKALVKAVIAATGAGIDTAYQNTDFKPTPGTPYQEVLILFARPENPTLGDDYFREQGVLKIVLRYPASEGDADILSRIETLRAAFKRGTTLVEGATRVVIDRTPEVGQGRNLDDRWTIPLTIPWYSEA